MPNVAVVVLDTLRKDAFDEHFDWLPGIRFEDAWSPGAWTVPAHAALFGGAYPSELGVYAKTQSLTCERPVLAERLSRAGYTTRGFSANGHVCDAFDFDRGFDEFETSWRGEWRDKDIVDWQEFLRETDDEGPTRFLRALYRSVASDKDTLASIKMGVREKADDLGLERIAGFNYDGARIALDSIRDTDFGTDEFLFVNLMDAHAPYEPPESYRTVDVETDLSIIHSMYDDPEQDPADLRQAYDDSVRYLSDVYEEIFAELSDEFDYVVTLSDHGEMFGTDGLWQHNYGIYPELTHVPVTLYRGRDEFEERDETVGLLDVHRTVLDLAGCENAPSRGENLLDGPTSREHLVERHGLRSSEMKTLKNFGASDQELQHYDRTKRGIVRPGSSYCWETLDGFKTCESGGDDDAKERLERLFDELDTADVTLDEDDDTEIPADVRDRLEDLGYA